MASAVPSMIPRVVRALEMGEGMKYGGLQTVKVRRMKDPERENAQLRRLVADSSLEGQVLAGAASGNFLPPSDAGRRSTGFRRSTASWCTPPAGSSAITGARNATCRRSRLMRMRRPAPLSPLHSRTDATAIAASPRCCRQVGKDRFQRIWRREVRIGALMDRLSPGSRPDAEGPAVAAGAPDAVAQRADDRGREPHVQPYGGRQ